MTHEEYMAEKAARTARVARRLAEAKAEYDRLMAAQGDTVMAAARRRGGHRAQARRRRNEPILSQKRGIRTPCACGCGRTAVAKGLARPCYMAQYHAEHPRAKASARSTAAAPGRTA